jgi:hypothetical protein
MVASIAAVVLGARVLLVRPGGEAPSLNAVQVYIPESLRHIPVSVVLQPADANRHYDYVPPLTERSSLRTFTPSRLGVSKGRITSRKPIEGSLFEPLVDLQLPAEPNLWKASIGLEFNCRDCEQQPLGIAITILDLQERQVLFEADRVSGNLESPEFDRDVGTALSVGCLQNQLVFPSQDQEALYGVQTSTFFVLPACTDGRPRIASMEIPLVNPTLSRPDGTLYGYLPRVIVTVLPDECLTLTGPGELPNCHFDRDAPYGEVVAFSNVPPLTTSRGTLLPGARLSPAANWDGTSLAI